MKDGTLEAGPVWDTIDLENLRVGKVSPWLLGKVN